MAETSNLNLTNVEQQAFISIRIVTMDHYMSDPITSDLDPVYSSFRSSPVKKVPVLRIFGPTASGQKTCLHLHGILPYMFVPKPEEADNTFPFRLAASLDKALNISLLAGLNNEADEKRSTSPQQHIFKIVEVRARPFYGYHPREHMFYKIFFYNPWLIKRAADILQNGAVMGRVLQPHFSHIPYTLQFMMDYNLQGMNMIHLRHCLFRRDKNFVGTSLTKGPNSSSTSHHTRNEQIEPCSKGVSKHYNIRNPPANEYLLPDNVARMSISELEIDAVAADILNTNDDLMSQTFTLPEEMSPLSLTPPLMKSKHALLSGKKKKLTNPGLEALWIDERMRRATLLQDDKESLSPPDSPPRNRTSDWKSDSQIFWEDRYDSMIQDMKDKGFLDEVIDPNDKDPDSTANFFKKTNRSKTSEDHNILDPIVYPGEIDEEDIQFLQEATELDYHVSSLSQSILCTPLLNKSNKQRKVSNKSDTISIKKSLCLDDSVVDEEILSQTLSESLSQKTNDNVQYFDEDETELMDLLKELGEERLLGTNSYLNDEQISEPKEKICEDFSIQSQFLSKRQFDQDMKDTLEMSQIWDSDTAIDIVEKLSAKETDTTRCDSSINLKKHSKELIDTDSEDIFSSPEPTTSLVITPVSQHIETDLEDLFASSQENISIPDSPSSKVKRAKVTSKKIVKTIPKANQKDLENDNDWDDDTFWNSINFDT